MHKKSKTYIHIQLIYPLPYMNIPDYPLFNDNRLYDLDLVQCYDIT